MWIVESLDIKNLFQAFDFSYFVIFLVIFGFHALFWILSLFPL